MDDGPSRRRMRTIIAVLSVASGCALLAFLATRRAHSPEVESSTGPASDPLATPEATLRAAPVARESVAASDAWISPAVAVRTHAEFLAKHPEATGRTAVAGRVVDANGQPVLSGWVMYRQPGTGWQPAQIEYDGTYEVNDVGPGPYELIASQGNGPIDRKAPITNAGFGGTDVVLRAPHDGVLKVRLSAPLAGRGKAFLTREDGESGLATSGLSTFYDGERFEFSGLDPAAPHALWIAGDPGDTYAYVLGVRSRNDEWVLAPTPTVLVEATIRSASEWTDFGSAELVGLGVSINCHFGGVAWFRSPDLSMPNAAADESLPRATYGLRLRFRSVPKTELIFRAEGYRFTSDKKTREFGCERPWSPGESIVVDWKESEAR